MTKESRSPRKIMTRTKFNLVQFKREVTTPKYIVIDKYNK